MTVTIIANGSLNNNRNRNGKKPERNRNIKMSIYLGNLSIDEIEKRSGVEFPQDLKEYMEPRKQESASNIAKGKWHCFDIPFVLVCGDKETATEIYGHLNAFSSDFKEPLQILLSGG